MEWQVDSSSEIREFFEWSEHVYIARAAQISRLKHEITQLER